MQKRWKVILFPCVLIGCLLCANVAAADTIGLTDGWEISDESFGGIPADLNGWSLSQWFIFLNPANQWTSAANLATMNSWLTIVDELSGIDPSLLSELYGLGMIGPSVPSPAVSNAPEPVLMGFLGVALLALGLYSSKRARAIREGREPPAEVISIDRDLQETRQG
jgi:hypothetical protein